jgi:hypothetical protein
MTLGDVVELTGVTLEFLAYELGLPEDISTDDRLGRVARDNGLSVAEVREAVERGISGVADQQDVVTEAEIREPPAADYPANQQPHVAEVPPVEEPHDEHAETMAGLADIRGSMTLAEIVALGVPREVLYRELGIPVGVPINERLGRLGRAYAFSMTQVRDLVDAHR